MAAFCRDCLSEAPEAATRCPRCGSPRLVRHPELHRLHIAHVDCDAFYAAVEKRDRPELRDLPVIIGGGKRGVVATACYVARTCGVRSAMPMFEARRLCPDAVVIKPDMAKYAKAGRAVRAMMLELTPLVEPLSIDEAFLDLGGTERLHGAAPAVTLARFARRVEREIGITVSVGLSENKFLAKLASDLEKPRGFSVLTQADAARFLAPKPVTAIFGVGKATAASLGKAGFRTVADLQRADETTLMRAFGAEGLRLARLACGIDARTVTPDRPAKSISAETTLDADLADRRRLEKILWPLCEKVSARLKAAGLAGSTVTLKLKRADHRLRTRSHSLPAPTALAATIFTVGRELLAPEIDGTRFRLIGIGVGTLASGDDADPPDLIDVRATRTAAAEHAVDRLREKFGKAAVIRGLMLDDADKTPKTPKS
ncbi:DNA polymerase IV [Rhodoplanes sp. TEM]|uniref:DNA polymerase IV n=1 Tax=Rhodoplanes tepidamans TaxID=200616 RepID=A0ABT5J6M0_RHOTP|nr:MULTISPECIES: DNA polymerase IV [Rhodoplanes]MDC7785261.1 DNA polymerase IV [Rhodoplanes tepidamans]MDC7984672.1 DNA polymerase IV [Rhodoplanes sp. TEM]MDQ0353519.1 DNA polymerase-4 [Rhodoplanes tepidamans]